MIFSIETFSKKYDHLICIDSDGTAIDAMNAKHMKCHGPSFIEEWGLNDHAVEIQAIWNKINLFDSTRGVNRFIALYIMLNQLNGNLLHVEPNELKALSTWIQKGDLSNESLESEILNNPKTLLKKALRWSLSVNEKITALTPEDKPLFNGVIESLQYASGKADIAVISSSNMSAILEEWTTHGIIEYINVMTSQEVGTKSMCIAKMLEKGYCAENVMMIGDAYPDVEASKENGIWYYPILTNQEKESWEAFRNTYFDVFLSGNYGQYQQMMFNKLEKNYA